MRLIGEDAFRGCAALKVLDLPVDVVEIRNYTFVDCTAFKTFILRSSSVVPLLDVEAFLRRPFGSGGSGGTVYAPSALITSYKKATNWSALVSSKTVAFKAMIHKEVDI